MQGTIKRVIRDRGFGFIRSSDGQEVFFHRSSLQGLNFDSLKEGSSVELEVERGPEEEIARYFDTERFRINSAHKSLQIIAANRYGENALSLARITDEQYGAGREL